MNTRYLFTALFVGVMLGVCAADRNIPSGYYSAMDGKSKEALKYAAHDCITGQKEISYSGGTWDVFLESDVRPDGTWWDIYSNERRYASQGHSGMNVEHGVANSWWGGTKNAAYKDIHHLFPSDANANSRKSNYPLGEATTVSWTNGVTTIGKPKNGHGGQGGWIYEPADEYKGDNARAYFYMATRYPDISWRTDNYTSWGIMFQQQSYPTLNAWSIELLLRWNELDPVSQKEIDRNEAIYKHQKNRNPFVDFPDLANYIWGDKMNEKFDLKAHLNGEGGGDDPTPPDPANNPVLISPVANYTLDFGTVSLGQEGSAILIVKGKNLDPSKELQLAVYDTSTTDDAGLFSVDGGATQTISVDAVNSESGLSVRIDYNPRNLGLHESHLRIRGGGLQGNTLINLRGTCVEAPVLTAPVALPATNVTATGYIANWQAVEEDIDYYVVNRTMYANGEVRTEQQQVHGGETSLEIDDFCGSETYTVQSVKNGVTSPESNVISVGETSISSLEAETLFGVQSVYGGVEIVCSQSLASLIVSDMSGHVLYNLTDVENGTYLSLPRGLYLLKAAGIARPVKIRI